MAASQISPHKESEEELNSYSILHLSLNICSGANAKESTIPAYFFLMYFQKCGGLKKVAPHILPGFNDGEIGLIANIPQKLTPYVKELGIR